MTMTTQEIRLPAPVIEGGMPLAEAIAARRSHREFEAKVLSVEQVSQLCWAAQGITLPREGYRAAPSAGAIFPLTLFVVAPEAVYEYVPKKHTLRPVREGDVRPALRAAALDQTCVGEAPLILVLAMDVAKMARKYGDDAESYCLMEMGHAAQNVALQAVALGLASVPVGAIEPEDVATILGLPDRREPAYLLPVGHPRA